MADKIWIHDRVKSLISLNFPSIFLFLFSFLRLFIYRDDRPCYERSNTAWESVHYISCSGWSGGGGPGLNSVTLPKIGLGPTPSPPPPANKSIPRTPLEKIPKSEHAICVTWSIKNWSLTLFKKRIVRLV